MGKFDGILIASDWDGTFYSNKLFEENMKTDDRTKQRLNELKKRFDQESGKTAIGFIK